ncbi:unnamed protein product [Protopolystoma xenopodis]|uniref:Uncharacterized protein n=1 Tax=Protopolystoma xenopodis TaxID=117903 RepID=A0A3S4ZQI6_9PLAT|nr:unnamed protein product [Protopolystoma xenopodis]
MMNERSARMHRGSRAVRRAPIRTNLQPQPHWNQRLTIFLSHHERRAEALFATSQRLLREHLDRQHSSGQAVGSTLSAAASAHSTAPLASQEPLVQQLVSQCLRLSVGLHLGRASLRRRLRRLADWQADLDRVHSSLSAVEAGLEEVLGSAADRPADLAGDELLGWLADQLDISGKSVAGTVNRSLC